jgi:hypothetical protein
MSLENTGYQISVQLRIAPAWSLFIRQETNIADIYPDLAY